VKNDEENIVEIIIIAIIKYIILGIFKVFIVISLFQREYPVRGEGLLKYFQIKNSNIITPEKILKNITFVNSKFQFT
jgi:hypothetical protein